MSFPGFDRSLPRLGRSCACLFVVEHGFSDLGRAVVSCRFLPTHSLFALV